MSVTIFKWKEEDEAYTVGEGEGNVDKIFQVRFVFFDPFLLSYLITLLLLFYWALLISCFVFKSRVWRVISESVMNWEDDEWLSEVWFWWKWNLKEWWMIRVMMKFGGWMNGIDQWPLCSCDDDEFYTWLGSGWKVVATDCKSLLFFYWKLVVAVLLNEWLWI